MSTSHLCDLELPPLQELKKKNQEGSYVIFSSVQEKIKTYSIITDEDEKNIKTVSDSILFQAEQKVSANNHSKFM